MAARRVGTEKVDPMSWQPRYVLTPAIARELIAIEAARAVVAHTPLPPAVEAAVRQRARVRSAQSSTQIDGNRLTLAEAEEVIAGWKVRFHGRERDQSEVQHYWNALLREEDWAARKTPLSEALICRLHTLIEKGVRARPTPYRDSQKLIWDSASGALIYLPPEAKDEPALMAALVKWAEEAEQEGVPAPLIAGPVHYQFVTIHPFYDGNGRTARLLATFLLHRRGYGLNGFYSLEEHHAHDLPAYYQAPMTHPHHNLLRGPGTGRAHLLAGLLRRRLVGRVCFGSTGSVAPGQKRGPGRTGGAAPAGPPNAEGVGPPSQGRADHLLGGGPDPGPFRSDGQGPAQGAGRRGVVAGSQRLGSGQGIRFTGNLSAIHRRFIGNARPGGVAVKGSGLVGVLARSFTAAAPRKRVSSAS